MTVGLSVAITSDLPTGTGGAPAETFYLAAETGDVLTAENGDRLTY